jgi:hypothetical protein
MRNSELVTEVDVTAKEILSYIGGMATFVAVALLLRSSLSTELAFGIGWLGMLLVGFPFTRYLSAKQLTFKKWALFSTLGAFGGLVVFAAINRFG